MMAMKILKSWGLDSMTSRSRPLFPFRLSAARVSRTNDHPRGLNSTVWINSRMLMRSGSGPMVSSGGTVSPNPISSTSLSIQFSNLPTPKILNYRITTPGGL